MARKSRVYIRTLLIAAVLVLLTNMTPLPAASAAEDIWTKDSPRAPELALSPKRIDWLLERIAEDDPKKAKELKRLRKKDPEQFQKQMHQEMQTFFEKHDRGRQRPGRAGDEHRPSMMGRGMGMGPGGMSPKEGFMGPGGMGMGRGKGRGGRWEDRVQQRHEDFIKWFEENHPEKAKKLIESRQKDPEGYMSSFRAVKERYGEIMEAHKKNPKHAKVLTEDLELKQQRDRLVRRLNSAGVDERAGLLAELEDTVSKRFDLIIKKKQFRYDALKKKLAKLKKEVEKREAELDELVKSKRAAVTERVKELAGKNEKINWD